MNWLGHECLRFVQTLNDEEQEKSKTSLGLFEVLGNKFKPQHNEMILQLKYCKLVKKQSTNAEEWMGYLRIKENQCTCKEEDGRLKESSLMA